MDSLSFFANETFLNALQDKISLYIVELEKRREQNRKQGILLSFREDYIYWKLAYLLVKEKEYQIISASRDYEEIWLENIKRKDYPIIRLRRFDIDWSNWIKNDLQMTVVRGDQMKKSYFKRDLEILNIYVSMEPPVDSYEKYFTNVVKAEKQRVTIRSLLMVGSDLERSLAKLEQLLDLNITANLKEEYESYEVDELKIATFRLFQEVEKNERKLFHQGKPFFTYAFLGLQIFIFLLMEMFGSSRNPYLLILFGAKYNPLILEGEWWRLITPMFLHIGLIHLVMNSFALYYLGTAVERIYGRYRFLFIYLFAGFAGTLASFLFSPDSISAGASGGIFGLFGALLFFGIVHPRPFFRTMGANVITLVGINLLIGFLPGIDFAGHLGGLVGGFLAASIVSLPSEKNWSHQLIAFFFTVLATAISLYFGFQR